MAEPDPNAPQTMKSIIPTEFHDRGYMKDFLDMPQNSESFAKVFSKLDGAETLIGRKTGIPADDAKPEEVEKFYSAMRPAKDSDYEIKGVGEDADKGFLQELRGAAFHGSLRKDQFSRFMEKLVPALKSRAEKTTTEKKEQDRLFDEIVTKTFGKDEEAVTDRVNAAIKEHTPENLKPFVDKMSNENLAILIGVVNGILVKHVPEDDLKDQGKGAKGGDAPDISDLRKEARELQASKAWTNFQDPEHEKTKQRVTDIYKRVGELQNAA